MTRLAVLCRAGFEPDVLAELQAWALNHGAHLQHRWSEPGMLLIVLEDASTATRPAPLPALNELVFVRDLLVVRDELTDLDTRNRFGPIETVLETLGAARRVDVLAADSDAGKPLAPLLRALESRVNPRLDPTSRLTTGVWLVSGNHALVGVAPPGGGALFAGGVARLRFPRDAPSRSTLKLDEAFCVLLTEAERAALLRAGLRAVDLGAAPGGWTYQLVQRHLRVIAVDNGRMDATLLQSGLVEHLREDGFRYRPRTPVDWLVCDMVEKPARVVELVVKWFQGGHCRAAIFNLKLPMKRRWDAWVQAQTALLPLTQRGLKLRARQLYHDREEITVALVPSGKVKPNQTKASPTKVQSPPRGRIARRRP